MPLGRQTVDAAQAHAQRAGGAADGSQRVVGHLERGFEVAVQSQQVELVSAALGEAYRQVAGAFDQAHGNVEGAAGGGAAVEALGAESFEAAKQKILGALEKDFPLRQQDQRFVVGVPQAVAALRDFGQAGIAQSRGTPARNGHQQFAHPFHGVFLCRQSAKSASMGV